MANEKRRLIDANALLDYLRNAKAEYEGYGYVDDAIAEEIGEIITAVEKTPTVEVVHGRWKDGHCTNCNHLAEVQSIGFNCTGGNRIDYKHTNYCPNCGAKMDGERREGE